MQINRLVIVRDTIHIEGGLPALQPVTRVAACAVVKNPLAGRAEDDVGVLIPYGEELGLKLVQECKAQLPRAATSYGKAAIVGMAGELEHGAAIMHPRMGRPMREALGGGKAIITSNVKIGAAGCEIDVPLTDKDDVWNFDLIDTITVMVPGAPRPDEIVVICALADGGRPRARVDKGGVRLPR